MKTTSLLSLALAICCGGCLPPTLLANRDRPHRVAERATVIAWCAPPEAAAGVVEKCKVELLPGDLLISTELLTGEPSK